MTTLEFIVGFFGGGLAGGMIQAFRASRAERAARAAEFLSEQLRQLYGPLFYWISQNESISVLTGKIHDAYKAEYCDKQYAESADEIISRETTETINLGNRYVEIMVENNNKMVEILNQNYGLIDPEDMEAFQNFRTNVMRYKIETEIRPNFRIAHHLDTINFFHSDFSKQLKKQFLTKTQQLSELRQLSRPPMKPVDWFSGTQWASTPEDGADLSPPDAKERNSDHPAA